jgi:hypothetical protein
LGSLRKSNDIIKQAVLSVDESVITPEILSKLVTNAPTTDEIKLVSEYIGDDNALSIPDKFVKSVSSISVY